MLLDAPEAPSWPRKDSQTKDSAPTSLKETLPASVAPSLPRELQQGETFL